jgi:hypothetical protein
LAMKTQSQSMLELQKKLTWLLMASQKSTSDADLYYGMEEYDYDPYKGR